MPTHPGDHAITAESLYGTVGGTASGAAGSARMSPSEHPYERAAAAFALGALCLAVVLWVSPVQADEPAQGRPTTSAPGGAEAEAGAGCDVCALRHRSKLRNRDRLRALREQEEDDETTEGTEGNREDAPL